MPKFSYIVKNKKGQTHKDTSDEDSRDALINKLQRQALFIVKIEEIETKKAQFVAKTKKKKFARKKVKSKDLLTFAHQISTMLQSGVTLTRSLEVILTQVESSEFHAVLKNIKDDIEQGQSLSECLAKHPSVFNQFWVSLIEVGEASGTIPKVLEKLAFYIEQQEAFKSAIISGIIYPAILFFVAVGAIFFFAFVIGPRFETIFNQMEMELPALTVTMLAIFAFIKNRFLLLVGGIGLFIFLLKKYTKTYSGKLKLEKFLFSVPSFGDTYRSIIVERFSSQMAILIESGVPILNALDITERLVNNNTCACIVGNIRAGVKEGQLLVAPMSASGFFPPMAIQMIMVGEETGELTNMLKHVAAYYQELVETFMKRFAIIFEPIMLVCMGAIIGLIVTAMFLPMLEMAKMG